MSDLVTPSFQDEAITMLAAAVRVIGSLIPPHIEVVLHDLRQPLYSIIEIVNSNVTGRKRGDPVLAGMRADKAFITAMEKKSETVSLVLDYVSYTREGKPLRSSTAIYRDSHQQPFAALCINADQARIAEALQVLNSFAGLAPIPAAVQPVDEARSASIETLMHDIIRTSRLAAASKNPTDSRQANLAAVEHMQQRGLFLVKGGVEAAAAALGVTRYTIYNYLERLRPENDER